MRVLFLAVALGILLGGMMHAQSASYDCFYVKAVKLSRVRGVVLDQQGKPLGGATVELLQRGADEALANTTTGADGTFRFDAPADAYWVHVKAKGFQTTGLSVHVDHGLFSFLNMRRLYLVLAVGGTAKPCPAEITSKKKLQEYIRDNATQK